MGTGYLKVQVRTGGDALPVNNAHVTLMDTDDKILYETYTDAGGNTQPLALQAPDMEHTLDPGYLQPAYSVWNVDVRVRGFIAEHIRGVEIVDTQTAILPVKMLPLADEPDPVTDNEITIPPISFLLDSERSQVGVASTRRVQPASVSANSPHEVSIPDYITVHLGVPADKSAGNVRVKFIDYVKNVASSEIYSTWPYNSLVANIHVIVTFALNRIYTEWYRNRGFNFDITNSTAYDQYYRDGAQIFENISKITDNIFNVYARRSGMRNPFFTSFCNGVTAACAGLSQWGTVTLANRGYTPLQILHYYYPKDLELVSSNSITGITSSYPGYALGMGSNGGAVRRMQNFLNRIRVNYPVIPPVPSPDGVFGTDTAAAVREFQKSFSLTPDGVIGRDTWNKISYIYVAVTRLAELDSEGERYTIGQTPPGTVLSQGSQGKDVLEAQFILNSIAPYYDEVPEVIQDGVFGPTLRNAVTEFQRAFGLNADGVVGPATWSKLYSVYHGIHKNVPAPSGEIETPPGAPAYPGSPLRAGAEGSDVRLMQSCLNTIRAIYPGIPHLTVDGVFGEKTRTAVIAFQNQFLLEPDGVIGPVTWDEIIKQYMQATGGVIVPAPYPGTVLREGSRGEQVRMIQGMLMDLRAIHQEIAPIASDGIFGPRTKAAVIAFQRLFGLTPDGAVGPVTWNAIVTEHNKSV